MNEETAQLAQDLQTEFNENAELYLATFPANDALAKKQEDFFNKKQPRGLVCFGNGTKGEYIGRIFDSNSNRLWIQQGNNPAKYLADFKKQYAEGKISFIDDLDSEYEHISDSMEGKKLSANEYAEKCYELEEKLNELGFYRVDNLGNILHSKVIKVTEFYDNDKFNPYHMHLNGTPYDREGYGREGYNAEDFNRFGFNREGISTLGTRLNKDLLTANGEKPDYLTFEQLAATNEPGHFLRFTWKKKADFAWYLRTYSFGIYVPDTNPEETRAKFSNIDRAVSSMVFDCKKYNKEYAKAHDIFNKAMFVALKTLICQKNIKGNIHLVCVPSSKVYRPGDKLSFERDFVQTAAKSYSVNGCKLLDGSSILVRTDTINPEHYMNGRTVNRQYESMECTCTLNNEDTYIVIDDIVTSGTILYTCDAVLINKGADKNKIYNLTLLATRDYKPGNGDPFYEKP